MPLENLSYVQFLPNLKHYNWFDKIRSKSRWRRSISISISTFEPPHDKTNKMACAPSIRPVWSESSLSAWKHLGPLATLWAHSEDSDQTGRTVILFVLSWGSSFWEGFPIANRCGLMSRGKFFWPPTLCPHNLPFLRWLILRARMDTNFLV